MDNYGIDKPDTRFDLRLHDLEIQKNTGFAVFSAPSPGAARCEASMPRALPISSPQKEIDKLADFVKTYRAKGLAYTRWTHEGPHLQL